MKLGNAISAEKKISFCRTGMGGGCMSKYISGDRSIKGAIMEKSRGQGRPFIDQEQLKILLPVYRPQNDLLLIQ